MKSIPLFVCAFMLMSFSNRHEKATLEMLAHEFSYAMEVRNFHEARHILHQMIPLMKQDIKYDKKMISKALRTDCANNEDIGELERDMYAKSEVLHFAEHLLHTSNAALRAKSSEMANKMESYVLALLWMGNIPF